MEELEEIIDSMNEEQLDQLIAELKTEKLMRTLRD
jgi:hypothetical protein